MIETSKGHGDESRCALCVARRARIGWGGMRMRVTARNLSGAQGSIRREGQIGRVGDGRDRMRMINDQGSMTNEMANDKLIDDPFNQPTH
jgi:hypothetical protein